MEQEKKDNLLGYFCWFLLVTTYLIVMTSYLADGEKKTSELQQRVDTIEKCCDSLQQQIDIIEK